MADSASSPTNSGCGWCGEVKQTMAEAKVRADGGDMERHDRPWRGGAHGSGGWLCYALPLLFERG
jgi:hypothetical protein